MLQLFSQTLVLKSHALQLLLNFPLLRLNFPLLLVELGLAFLLLFQELLEALLLALRLLVDLALGEQGAVQSTTWLQLIAANRSGHREQAGRSG
jgi:hypothetical protein